MKSMRVAIPLALATALGLAGCSTPSAPAGPAGMNGQAPSFVFTPPASSFQAVAGGSGLMVAVGQSAKNSVDGLTWTTDTSAINSDFASHSVIFANGGFFAIDRGGRVHKRDSTTPGSGNWTIFGLSGVSNAEAIAYGSSAYVAVGSSGTIAYSPDAAAWNPAGSVPASAFRQLHGVAYGAEGFVAVGSNDSNNVFSDIVISGDGGVNWAEAASYPAAGTLRGIAYGNGKYVAVGDGDSLLISSDGQNWSRSSAPVITSILYAVAFANGLLAVNGTNGTILTSPNGLSWSDQSWANLASATLTFYGVAGFDAVNDIFLIADY
jgi:hypothetical protein